MAKDRFGGTLLSGGAREEQPRDRFGGTLISSSSSAPSLSQPAGLSNRRNRAGELFSDVDQKFSAAVEGNLVAPLVDLAEPDAVGAGGFLDRLPPVRAARRLGDTLRSDLPAIAGAGLSRFGANSRLPGISTAASYAGIGLEVAGLDQAKRIAARDADYDRRRAALGRPSLAEETASLPMSRASAYLQESADRRRAGLSEEQKRVDQKASELAGSGRGLVDAILSDPLDTAYTLARGLGPDTAAYAVPFIGSRALAARGLMSATGATEAGVAAQGAAITAGIASDAADQIMQAPESELLKSAHYRAIKEAVGGDPQQAREALAERAYGRGLVAGGAINALTMGGAQRLGLNPVGDWLGGSARAGSGGVWRGMAAGAGREFLGEAAQGAGEAFANEVASYTTGTQQDGALDRIAGGALAEGLMGGTTGAVAGGAQSYGIGAAQRRMERDNREGRFEPGLDLLSGTNLQDVQADAIRQSYESDPVDVAADREPYAGDVLEGSRELASQIDNDPDVLGNALEDIQLASQQNAMAQRAQAEQAEAEAATRPYMADAAPRMEGETDKQYAKRVIDHMPDPRPDQVADDPARYFDFAEGTPMMAVEDLIPTKRERAGDNAARRFAAAAEGGLSRRAPIDVRMRADGKVEVVDGNGTHAAAEALGWKELPVNIVGVEPAGKWADIDRGIWESFAEINQQAAMDETRKANQPKEQSAPADPHTPLGILKDDATLEQLNKDFRAAAEALPKVKAQAEAMADRVGAELLLAPLKGRQRAEEKAQAKVNRGAKGYRLSDMLRMTLVANTPAEASAIFDQVMAGNEIGTPLLVDGKPDARNHWAEGSAPLDASGYRDAQIILETPNGTRVEVQVSTPQMLEVKGGAGHTYYEAIRLTKVAASARFAERVQHGEDVTNAAPPLTESETDLIARAERASREAYGGAHPELADARALRNSTAAQNSSSEMGSGYLPGRGLPGGTPGQPLSSTANSMPAGVSNNSTSSSDDSLVPSGKSPRESGMPQRIATSGISSVIPSSVASADASVKQDLTSTAEQRTTADKVVAKASATFPGLKVNVVDSWDALPPTALAGQQMEPASALYGNDGQVYLVANQIGSPIDAARSMLHETFHAGIRKVVGEAEFDALMENVWRRAKLTGDRRIRQLVSQIRSNYEGEPDAVLGEEVLAHIAETYDTTLPPGPRHVLGRLMDAVRAIARKAGLMAGMTDNEIYALVRRGMGAARSEGRAEGGQARAKRREVDTGHGVVAASKPGTKFVDDGKEVVYQRGKKTQLPPFLPPVNSAPNYDNLHSRTAAILQSPATADYLQRVVGVKGAQVTVSSGSYEGVAELNYLLRADGMTFNQAERLALLTGLAFSQDAVIVSKPTPRKPTEDSIPTLEIRTPSGRMNDETRRALTKALRDSNIDYSETPDGEAVRVLYFGDESGFRDFGSSALKIASEVGLKVDRMHTRSSLYEGVNYRQDLQGAWNRAGRRFGPEVFRGSVDHLLVPFIRAAEAEGFQFDADRYADRFGLEQADREYLKQKLADSRESRSTAPILRGDEKLEIAGTGKRGRANVNDVARAFNKRTAERGSIGVGDFSPAALERIATDLADEVIYQLGKPTGKSAVGWYDAKLREAIDAMAGVFPEIKTDQNAAFVFKGILASTSQGLTVTSNFSLASKVYAHYRANGTVKGHGVSLPGKAGAVINANLNQLQDLIDKIGLDGARRVMTSTATRREIEKSTGLKISDYALDEVVRGWMALGPKIGSFANNLYGDFSTLTADLWFSRTWNRMLGRMFRYSPDAEQQQIERFRSALSNVLESGGNAVVESLTPERRAGLGSFESDMALAQEITEAYSKGGFKDRTEITKSAKNWVENVQQMQEAPRGAKERRFQRDALALVQRKVSDQTGTDISIADLQALLWYQEKELFGAAGAANKASAPLDYADAAKLAVKEIQDGQAEQQAATRPDASGNRRGRGVAEGNGEEAGSQARASRKGWHDREVQQGASQVSGRHYANTAGLKALDPTKYGTNHKGAESRRLDNAAWMDEKYEVLQNRVYFYPVGSKLYGGESMVGRAETHDLSFDNLYNGNADPRGLWERANELSETDGVDIESAFEYAVIEAGFDGWFNADMGVLLDTKPVPVGKARARRTDATAAAFGRRIDEVFAIKDKRSLPQVGVRILDGTEQLALIGYPDKPLVLNERHIFTDAGSEAHPELAPADWKKLPAWLDNPVAIFESENHPGCAPSLGRPA